MKTSKVELYIDGVLQSCVPIYSDNISIDKEREDNEMFIRTKLSSSLTFVGEDFRAIYNSGLDTKFEVRIYDEETNVFLAKGTFEKIDCTFNVDDEKCDVKISSADDYDNILNGKGNEYDIVALAPVREKIHLAKRAILQIYAYHDTKVTNIIGNMSYEINCKESVTIGNAQVGLENITPTQLVDNLSFTKIEENAFHLNLTGDAKAQIPTAIGKYNYTGDVTKQVGSQTGTYHRYTNTNGLYHVDFIGFFDSMTGVLWDSGDNVVDVNSYEIYFSWIEGDTHTVEKGVWYSSYYGGAHHLIAKCGSLADFTNGIYARILMDNPSPATPMGNIRVLTENNDICSYNMNYRYTMPVDIGGLVDKIVVSYEVQDEPTKWGVDGDGKYFVQPAPQSSGDNVIPIGWNLWISMSFWFNSTEGIATIIDIYDSQWDLNDAYPLWSVIQVLLEKIDSEITFDGTSAYSQFLYGTISSSVIFGWVKNLLYITPITNVKRTYYNHAARKGKLTLESIFEMLRSTCQLYWFIDSQKRLRIEHITWFKNGGTYAQANPLIDLTAIKSPMSGESWGFAQNTIGFNKSALIKRYEFAWNDKTSDVFDGYPIDIHNRFLNGGKTNKASVGHFVSDIDLVMSSPDAISDDIFALIGVDLNKRCVIVSAGNFGMDFVAPYFKMQNPYLSFYYLEMAYWTYDLGGNDATISGFKTYAGEDGVLRVYDTKRAKTQSVRFPITPSNIGKEGLIKTAIDNGEWTKEKYTPEDGMVEMDLVMATKDDTLISVGEFVGNGITMTKEGNNVTFLGDPPIQGYGYVRVTANKNVTVTMNCAHSARYLDYGWAHTSPLKTWNDVNAYATRKVTGYGQHISFDMSEGRSMLFGYIKGDTGPTLEDAISITFVEQ